MQSHYKWEACDRQSLQKKNPLALTLLSSPTMGFPSTISNLPLYYGTGVWEPTLSPTASPTPAPTAPSPTPSPTPTQIPTSTPAVTATQTTTPTPTPTASPQPPTQPPLPTAAPDRSPTPAEAQLTAQYIYFAVRLDDISAAEFIDKQVNYSDALASVTGVSAGDISAVNIGPDPEGGLSGGALFVKTQLKITSAAAAELFREMLMLAVSDGTLASALASRGLKLHDGLAEPVVMITEGNEPKDSRKTVLIIVVSVSASVAIGAGVLIAWCFVIQRSTGGRLRAISVNDADRHRPFLTSGSCSDGPVSPQAIFPEPAGPPRFHDSSASDGSPSPDDQNLFLTSDFSTISAKTLRGENEIGASGEGEGETIRAHNDEGVGLDNGHWAAVTQLRDSAGSVHQGSSDSDANQLKNVTRKNVSNVPLNADVSADTSEKPMRLSTGVHYATVTPALSPSISATSQQRMRSAAVGSPVGPASDAVPVHQNSSRDLASMVSGSSIAAIGYLQDQLPGEVPSGAAR